MNAYRIVLSVIDFEELGEEGIKRTIESTRFQNDCINPHVQAINCADIGDWHDGHPMNKASTVKAEFIRLFAELEARTPAATIDTPEFQKRFAYMLREEYAELVAHIDSRTPAAPVVAEGLTDAMRDLLTDLTGESDILRDRAIVKAENLLAAHPVAPAVVAEGVEPVPQAGMTTQDALKIALRDLTALSPEELRAELDSHKGKLRLEYPAAAEPMPASEAPYSWREAVERAAANANHVFSDSCDHTKQAIDYMKVMMDTQGPACDYRTAAPVPASEAASQQTLPQSECNAALRAAPAANGLPAVRYYQQSAFFDADYVEFAEGDQYGGGVLNGVPHESRHYSRADAEDFVKRGSWRKVEVAKAESDSSMLSEHEIGAIMRKWQASSNSRYELCSAVEAEVATRFRAEGGITNDSTTNLAAPAAPTDKKAVIAPWYGSKPTWLDAPDFIIHRASMNMIPSSWDATPTAGEIVPLDGDCAHHAAQSDVSNKPIGYLSAQALEHLSDVGSNDPTLAVKLWHSVNPPERAYVPVYARAAAPTDAKDQQPAFEAWAKQHGGLSLDPVGPTLCADNGMPLTTYHSSRTEIAWRAWANKPGQDAQSVRDALEQAAKVRDAAWVVVRAHMDDIEFRVHVCDRDNEAVKILTCREEVQALYRALIQSPSVRDAAQPAIAPGKDGA